MFLHDDMDDQNRNESEGHKEKERGLEMNTHTKSPALKPNLGSVADCAAVLCRVLVVVKQEKAVVGLIGMMRCGTPRGKENAVATLLDLCRSGGSAATEMVVKAPALAGLLQTLLFTITKLARRRAASLARVFQRCENASLHYGGLGVGYAYASNSAQTRDTSFAAGDVSIPMSIFVPVL